MSNHVIKNEEELGEALNRLDEIWIARPGDDDFDEREDLIDAIVKYEDENYKLEPPTKEDLEAFLEDQLLK